MKIRRRLRASFSFSFSFIFIFWSGVAGDDVTCQPVQVRLNQSASLTCRVQGNSTVVQSEWTRCNDSSSIVVFSSTHRLTVNEPYRDRVRIQDYHTLTLTRVQEEDFGMYCCKITAFPSGSLEGRVHLELTGKEPTPLSGSSMMTWIYISCGVAGLIILLLIGIALACKKKKRKIRNPVHVTLRCASVSPHQPSVLQKDPHTPEDEDDEDGMYLNMKTSP
ncbi:nectin-3-like protein [Trichomycterus rosablanca]|uniref:nectin-3-like protein n=1 Tax=Trichomycterus rosablanca TaxID=2290929 RepID=UPI002F34FDFF